LRKHFRRHHGKKNISEDITDFILEDTTKDIMEENILEDIIKDIMEKDTSENIIENLEDYQLKC